ncbi:MAG: hypothetical protein DWQ01_03270 [Planctomycetota bacterium]|nr:MAG: hypothetical protein DWQ01_03270 [Planctomycetota bacterium]
MGNRSHIGTFDNQPLQGNYQGNLADICPVGALTLKDFRFQARVWNTHSVPSTCTRCSRGCAVMVDAYRGRLVRIRPRYDAKVNRSWMCDFGRFQLQDLNLPGRLSGAIQEQQQGLRELPLEQALETAAENLRAEASQSFLLASNYATLEVGQALMELAKSLQTEAYFLKPSAWGGDGILRTDDPGPNSFGLQELGLKALAPDQARERLAAAEASLLVGEKLLPLLLQQDPTAGSTLPPIDTGRTAILVDTHLRSGFALTLPGLTWAETQGRVKNLDGHTRILRPALPGPDGVPQTHDLVQSLCARVRRDPDAHSTPNLQPSGMPV